MNFNNFKVDFNQLKTEVNMHRLATIILSLALLLSVYGNITNKQIITQEISPLCSEMTYGYDFMNSKAHERLGVMIANVLGNANPSNSDYVKDSVLEFVSSNIYNQVNNILIDQINELKRDEVTLVFESDNVQFENGLVYVSGNSITRGVTGKEKRNIRTYVLQFDVVNYTPTLVFIDVYDDVPRNAQWRAKNASKK